MKHNNGVQQHFLGSKCAHFERLFKIKKWYRTNRWQKIDDKHSLSWECYNNAIYSNHLNKIKTAYTWRKNQWTPNGNAEWWPGRVRSFCVLLSLMYNVSSSYQNRTSYQNVFIVDNEIPVIL